VEEAEVDEVDFKSADVQPVEEVVEQTTEDAEPVVTDEVVTETAEELVVAETEVVEAIEETEEPVQEDVKSYDDEQARRMRDELTRKLLAQRMQN
jgi:prophage DNA circulation protein